MKHQLKSWLFKACTLCLGAITVMHWDKFSLLLFGEPDYPKE